MKKLFIIVITIFLFPLSLISQTPQIEPSWELSPYNSSLNEIELIPTDFVETNSDCGIVSFIYMPRLMGWQRGTYIWELGTGNGSRILESGKLVK